MTLIKYAPTTPGRRFLIRTDRSCLWSGKPLKSLTVGLGRTGGRNHAGRITSWHIGGGSKRSYRLVDFKRDKCDVVATVERIEYDPFRSAFIALINYDDGVLSYILAADGMRVGDRLVSSQTAEISIGNCLPLENIPVGTTIHNVEIKPGKGGQIGRAAGVSIKVVGKDSGYAQLKLQSSEIRMVLLSCRATVGSVTNADHKNTVCGKAGRARWLGRKPTVRGVVMNPVDHPHGGGEGKTSGGRHPVTPWGKGTKGKKTRSNKATSKYIVKRRKK